MPQKVTVTCSSAATIELDEFIPFQGELKTLSNSSYQRLKASILKYGVSFPFYVWEHRGKKYGIDGHQRDRVLRYMRDEEGYEIPPLPVDFIQARSRREAKEKILILCSNYGKLSEESIHQFISESEIVFSDLKDILDLPEIDLDHLEQGWFSGDSGDEDDGGVREEDLTADVPEDPVTKAGDIWELGEHWIVCGDSTDKQVIQSLRQQGPIDLIFTDPPYGINIVTGGKVGGGGALGFGQIGGGNWVDARTYKKIDNDDSIEAARRFYNLCLELAYKNYVIWGGHYFSEFLRPSPPWVVWDKENAGNNFGDVELAWTSFSKSTKLYHWKWSGLIREGSRDLELPARVHPTQKPVGLFVDIFEDFSFKTCLDGFLGSGTTLIAADQLGRQCYGIEKDPGYVDVAVDRFVKLNPDVAIKRNGQDVEWATIRN